MRCRQQQPLPSPLGEGGPAGPDERQPPAAALSRANRRGRRPRRPAEACAAANNSPCLPPRGKVAPQGRMRGGLPPPPIPRANRRGRRPRRPVKPPANTHPPGNHPRRGQDPSLRTEPLTGVRVTPRAGHARPLPCGGPGTGVRVNPAGISISPSVGRGAPTPPRPPLPPTTALAFPLGGRWPRRAG